MAGGDRYVFSDGRRIPRRGSAMPEEDRTWPIAAGLYSIAGVPEAAVTQLAALARCTCWGAKAG